MKGVWVSRSLASACHECRDCDCDCDVVESVISMAGLGASMRCFLLGEDASRAVWASVGCVWSSWLRFFVDFLADFDPSSVFRVRFLTVLGAGIWSASMNGS